MCITQKEEKMEKVKNNKLVWPGALIIAFTFMFSALIMPMAANRTVHATSSFDGTSLAGTTWDLSELGELNPDNEFSYSINFTSNGNNYTSFSCKGKDIESVWVMHLDYDTNWTYVVYEGDNEGSWDDNAHKIITINSGADAVDGGTHFEALRAWLNANATLQSSGGGSGGDPATGVVEDTIAISLFAVVAGATISVVLVNNKKRQH